MGEPDGNAGGTDAFIDLTAAPAPSVAPSRTIYDDVRRVILDRGLSRGEERGRRGDVGLVGAIEVAVREPHESTDSPGREGARLAREARIARHLRELAGASNLGAWVDGDGRSLDDVLELLSLAAVAYPED
jgi:hypothetical protein